MDWKRPNLTVWQIINMSIGFFGIQHGFEIQFARMSSIYEKLGAQPDNIPFLWLAAPLTGLIVQPIIGYMSDRTWWPTLRMRRRPYFMFGAILGTIALMAMPNAGSLWVAVGLLWILDTSLNISMEPFRAFVADKLNTEQRPRGYAYQSLMIGIGTIIGNWIASTDFIAIFPGLKVIASSSMQISFYLCALIFIIAIIYTVSTTPEYPPVKEELEAVSNKSGKQALTEWWSETCECYKHMPPVMKRLALVQFFTWMGLFCMWMFYTVAVAHHTFGAIDPHSELYDKGIRWGAHTMMVKGIATPLFAFCIPLFVKYLGRVGTHTFTLVLCGIGLMTIPFISNPIYLYLPMIAAGIAWASIVAMPYVILVEHLPAGKYGIFMGIFNAFIVIPEICVSLGVGKLIMRVCHNDYAWAVAVGGLLMIIAAVIMPSISKLEKKEIA